MDIDDFELRLSAAVYAGEIPAEMFDELADRRVAAEEALHDYAHSHVAVTFNIKMRCRKQHFSLMNQRPAVRTTRRMGGN